MSHPGTIAITLHRGVCRVALSVVFASLMQMANAQVVQGTLDAVNSSTCETAGWARDPQNTNPIQVRIYRDGDLISGTLVATFVANLLRSDLPFSDQNHGFDQTFVTNPLLADGKSHSLYAYGVTASGGTGPLNGNAKIIQCASLGSAMSTNVKDYGAKGDGVNDDSNAIQAAINDTLPGGTVFIPEGVYIIGTSHGQQGTIGPNACGIDPSSQEQSGLMVRKPNLRITGAGRGTILKLANRVKMRIISILGPNTLIEKLVLDGNGANRVQIDPATGQPFSWPCGLVVGALLSGNAAPIGNVTVRDIESRNGIEDGLGVAATPSFTVQSVYVHDNGGYGVNPAYKNLAGAASISLSGGPNQVARDNVMIGNTTGVVVGFGSVGVDVQYNVALRNCAAGLILGTGPAFVPSGTDSNFLVAHNWVEQNGAPCIDGAADVVGGQNGVFSNNYVVNNAYPGLLFTDRGAGWPAW